MQPKRTFDSCRTRSTCWVLVFATTISHPAFGQGTAFQYQGRLSHQGNPAEGLYDFTFTVFDAAQGGNPLGTGTQTNTVQVAGGVFSTTLDFGPNVFTGPARWLELGIRTNGPGPFQILSPRQELFPTPYAIHAATAGSAQALPANTIQTPALADNAVTAAKIAAGQVVKSLNGLKDNVVLQAGNNVQIATNGNNLTISTSGGGGGLTLPFSGSTASANPALQLANTGAGTGVQVDTGDGWAVFGRSQKNLGVFGQTFADNAAGVVGRNESAATGQGQAVFGYASGNAVGVLGVSEGNDGVSGRSNGDGRNGVFGYTEKSTGRGGHFVNAANGPGMTGVSEGGTAVEGFSTTGWAMFGRSQNNLGVFGQTLGADSAGVLGRNEATTGRGQAVFGYASGNAVGVLGVSEGNDGVSGRSNAGGKSGVFGYTERSDGWGGYFVNAANGEALHAEGRAWVSGEMSVAVLTIRGGADLAEPFESSDGPLPPGSVVVIDPDRPGRLRLATEVYDTKVAGVISGAGGVQPGIALRQAGALEGGQHVALTGRVYVLADAAFGAIQPGDLLTTSATPGHAMKAADPRRASGAVLGKAMTPLAEGRGLVLVLVSLQ